MMPETGRESVKLHGEHVHTACEGKIEAAAKLREIFENFPFFLYRKLGGH